MYHTPWTKKTSSLPSDRINPSQPQNVSHSKNASKGKGKNKEPQSSREVRRLSSLVEAVRDSTGNTTTTDPKGGCYCLATVHGLSPHTPICRSCGLILCDMNEPYHACPHCSFALLSAADRSSLIAKLDAQILETWVKEENDRERAAEEARRAAGAFPLLAGGGGGGAGNAAGPGPGQGPQGLSSGNSSSNSPSGAFTPRPPNQTHKVLSLHPKTKKVTVATYSTPTAPSRPLPRGEELVKEPTRVPRPASEVSYVKERRDPSRIWADERCKMATYVPVSRVDGAVDAGSEATRSGRRRAKKGKGREDGNGEEDLGVGQRL